MPEAGFEPIVGESHVERATLAEDESFDGVPVEARVHPGDANEVAACLAQARAQGLAVVPYGGGSKRESTNPLAAKACVRLDLDRLDHVDLEPDEGVARVGAGVPVAELSRQAEARGKRVLLGAFEASATVGGAFSSDTVSAESSLDRRRIYEVLGVSVALVNGSVAQAGGRVVKNVTGFDLVRLYAGAFGTLGVVTELYVRLRPLPQRVCVLRREHAELGSAIAAAQELRLGPVQPDGILVQGSTNGATLTWLIEGSSADVERRAAGFEGEPASHDSWTQRLEPSASASRCRARLGARPADAGALTDAVAAHAASEAIEVLPLIGSVRAEVDATGLERLAELASGGGFAFRVERAPLELRRRVDAFGAAPATLPLMQELKRRFDPDRTLCPGRFVGDL